MTAIDVNNQEKKIELDFGDSMSYFSRKKSIDTSNSIESVSITFDTDRDYAMTTFCSNLITSMIEPRRAMIHKDSLNPEGVYIKMYGIEEIKKCAKSNRIILKHKIQS